MIPTIRTSFRTVAVFLLLTGSLSSATPPTYYYLTHVVEQFEATAGEPTSAYFSVQNNGTSPLTLDVSLPLNPYGHFSIDTLNSTANIQPGQMRNFFVFFHSPLVGSSSALLMVTDGTLTDTLTITATVGPGQGIFAFHPARITRSTYLNTPVRIPVSVQNLTNADLTVQTVFYANPAFTFSGTDSITLAPYGSQTLLIDFISSEEGRFDGRMTVRNGNFSLEAIFFVYVDTRKYAWVVEPIYPDEVEIIGQPGRFPISVENRGTTAVNLQVSLTGSNIFSLDPADQSFTLAPGNGRDLNLGILGTVLGSYSTLITVTDGVKTDSINLTARIIESPGGFAIYSSSNIDQKENLPGTMNVTAINWSSSSIDLSLSITGDSHFAYNGANPITLASNAEQDIVIDFAAAPPGGYYAKVYATDGIDVDSVQLVAVVQDEPDFFDLPNASLRTLEFETERDSTTTKQVMIENVSGDTLDVLIDLVNNDGGFTVAQNHLFLNADETASFDVSYTNDTSRNLLARLYLTARTQTEQIFLSGHAPYFNIVDGFRVVKSLSLRAADTSDQECGDVSIENQGTGNIMVISAVLSGFCSNFTMTDLRFPIILTEHERIRPTICYNPTIPGAKDYEILTITFDNPASNPRVQTLNVYLYGYSDIPHPRYIGGGMAALTARIDEQAETTMAIQNSTSTDITFDILEWKHGDASGIFSLVTPLPLTVTALNPAVPGSGTADITLRYAPTAQSSTVGIEDIAVYDLKSGSVNPPWIARIHLFGTPLPHSAPASQLLLFPRDMRTQQIDLGDVPLNEIRSLQFVNNLQVTVTISGFDLGGSRFDIANKGDFPLNLAPMESVTLELRCIAATDTRIRQDLTARGSHETLGSGYALFSGTGTLGTDDPDPVPQDIKLSISPNPSGGTVTMQLSAPLLHASVTIVDMLGRIVAQADMAGLETWTWSGMHGAVLVPPGNYSVFIRGFDYAGHSVKLTKNMVVIR
ncbi:MAG: hypothetical protein WC824_00795 [Bacteroidota bacterium]